MEKFIVAAVTDLGIKRKSNQDSIVVLQADIEEYGDCVFAVLCDGMGGLAQGEQASAAVVTGFENWFLNRMNYVIKNKLDSKIIENELYSVIEQQNTEIKKYGDEKKISLGTTIALLLLINGSYTILNIGDSRIYGIRGNKINQLTEDHTLVAKELKNGTLTKEEARTDRRKHILLQCVGAGEDRLYPYFDHGFYEKGDYFLLCSDGFYNKVKEDEVLTILTKARNESELREQLNKIIRLDKERNEKDNITAIGIKVVEK